MAAGEDQRPDERIQDDVSERLAAEPRLDASQIQVTVTDGEVTLAGTVDGPETRRRAEDIVASAPGVRSVINNLRVSQPGGTGVVG